MRVLMISGDKNLLQPGTPAHERFLLQQAAVEELVVIYWGRGSIWPRLPKGHFDVVTAQDPFWRGLFALRVARKIHARCNVQVHTDLAAQSFVRHVLAQIVLRHADSVRVVSEKIKKQVEHIGIKGPITVLPVFVDIERFRSLVRKPHSQKTILWVGRFEEEKNPLQAIEVLKEVLRVIPEATLTMLGKGTYGKKLLHSATHLPVDIPGWKDPSLYLDTADVVLCTSKHESWGASIVEALAAGVPVVAPDVGIAKEAGAITVPHEQLAQKVIEVLQGTMRGELRIQLSEKEEWASRWKETLL